MLENFKWTEVSESQPVERLTAKKASIQVWKSVTSVCWLISDFLLFPECPGGTFFIYLWVSLWVLKSLVVNCSSFSENDRCTHQSVCNRLLYKWLERYSCCLCAVTAADKYWELVTKRVVALFYPLKPKQSWFCVANRYWLITWHSPVVTTCHRTPASIT